MNKNEGVLDASGAIGASKMAEKVGELQEVIVN